MTQIPKLTTRQEEIKRQLAEGTPLIEIMLEGMFGGLKKLPHHNDQREVYLKATNDFKRMDFSEAAQYVSDLCDIADRYEELATDYLRLLKDEGYDVDEYGEAFKPEPKP